MRYIFFIISFTVAINPKLCTQVVTQVKAEQLGNSVLVNYYLQSEFPCEVELQVSTDGGHIFTTPTNGLSVDIGKNITQGEHLIRWEVLESMEALASSNVCFKVVAERMYAFRTVQIGNQRWMADNLNVDCFRNGDPIPEAKTAKQWQQAGQSKQPAWCYIDNDTLIGKSFGKLYNWFAVNDPRGLAPDGWHVPSDDDWTKLSNFLGGDSIAGVKLQNSQHLKHYQVSNCSEFSGLLGGSRAKDGFFYSNISTGYWWTSSDYDSWAAYGRYIKEYKIDLKTPIVPKEEGLSVRCIED